MKITIETLLDCLPFDKIYVLAGKGGLNRFAERISVFDCPIKESILDKNILESGDLFLSGLNQFLAKKELLPKFIQTLYDAKCSGLFITDENLDMITPEIVSACDNLMLPLIVFDKNISYATIMNAINKILILEQKHAINRLYLEKLLNINLPLTEKIKILADINPSIEDHLSIVIVDGSPHSAICENDLNMYFANTPSDCYIKGYNNYYFIFSSSDTKKVKTKASVFCNSLQDYFSSYSAGSSGLCNVIKIHTALAYAKHSLDIAHIQKQVFVEYDPSSTMPLTLSLQDKPEFYDFYNTILAKIKACDPNDSLDLISTICDFIKFNGSYSDLAVASSQHHNTIRYRVSRVRQALGMEDNIIKFYETISIFVKIHQIILFYQLDKTD